MSVNDATRWVLMGYGPLGRRVLEASLEGAWPPAGVMTHSEPSDLEDPSVESVARKAGLLVSTANPNEEGLQWLADLRPDTIFTINYRLILSPEVLAVPAIGGFNIHGSLLPRLRGRAPLTWAIIQGHRETGVTVHKLEPEVDTGEIVVQERIPIDVKDTSASIQTRMAELYPSMVRDTLEAVGTGRLTTRPQVGGPSYGAARRPDDGEIDWSWGAKRIYDWVRALSKPYPGAFTHLESEKVMIWKASIIESDTPRLEPGVIVGRSFSQDWGLKWAVACNDGYVVLEDMEPALSLRVGIRLGRTTASQDSDVPPD